MFITELKFATGKTPCHCFRLFPPPFLAGLDTVLWSSTLFKYALWTLGTIKEMQATESPEFPRGQHGTTSKEAP